MSSLSLQKSAQALMPHGGAYLRVFGSIEINAPFFYLYKETNIFGIERAGLH
jgi:hypothetical protein